jgi:uncharacterized protein involved in exopolysaccharide biosynthesis
MSLIQFFRILWARRIIIIVSVLACCGAAFIGGKIIPARFTAASRVMLDIVKPDPVTGEIISSGFARAYMRTQIELIRDYRIAGRAADSMEWTSSPVLAAQYAARPASDKRDFRRWLAQRIIDGTTVNMIEGSNILEISYTTANAENAAKVADALRRAYVDQALASKRDDASANSAWFRKQAERIRGDLKLAETRKSDFERANGIVLDATNTDEESKRLSALAGASSASPAVIGGMAAPNPVAGQLAQIDAAIASTEKVLGPNHPDLQNMRRQRAAIAAAGAQASRVVGGGASGPSLASQYGAQQAKVLAQRGKVDEARQLATDVDVLRDQYLKTSARAADLQQQGESSESGLTMLGNATPPSSPSFPNWPLLIFGSLGLGSAIGILVALMAELLGRRVRGVEDLRQEKVPVLGMMTALPTARPSGKSGGLLSRLTRKQLEQA